MSAPGHPTSVTLDERWSGTRRRRLQQPPGLALLFAVEMWERFSYYGMRALLILYLIDRTAGLGWTQESAGRLYGWYTGLIWFTPILGGYLADRILGTHRSLAIGGIAIGLGHFALALDLRPLFFAGLVLILVGTGFFKANVSTMVGELYGEHDVRRDAGYSVFYMGINLGALIGPLVCGYLAASPRFGWPYAFGAAGVGMALGLALYLMLRRRLLGNLGAPPDSARPAARATSREPGLTSAERGRVAAILVLVGFAAVFFLASEQAGSSLNVFALERVDRTVGGWLGARLPDARIPTAWFQSVIPFFVITLSPLYAKLWLRLAERQPSAPTKMALGLLGCGAGYVLLVVAERLSASGSLISPWWLVGTYFLVTSGEVCLYPVGLSFVSVMAPRRLASALMGMFFLSLFIANLAGGYIAGAAQRIARGGMFTIFGGRADFFLLFVLSCFAAGALLLALRPALDRLIHRSEGAA